MVALQARRVWNTLKRLNSLEKHSFCSHLSLFTSHPEVYHQSVNQSNTNCFTACKQIQNSSQPPANSNVVSNHATQDGSLPTFLLYIYFHVFSTFEFCSCFPCLLVAILTTIRDSLFHWLGTKSFNFCFRSVKFVSTAFTYTEKKAYLRYTMKKNVSQKQNSNHKLKTKSSATKAAVSKIATFIKEGDKAILHHFYTVLFILLPIPCSIFILQLIAVNDLNSKLYHQD